MTDNTQSGSDIDVTRKDTPTEVDTRSIKGTQELDEILNVLYMQAEDIGKLEYGSATHQITAVNGAKQAVIDWYNKQIAKARLNEAQLLYEDAINSTSHGHITYARKRVERHLETIKEHKEAEL